jgi:uncharacterized protein (TIGR03435 family)
MTSKVRSFVIGYTLLFSLGIFAIKSEAQTLAFDVVSIRLVGNAYVPVAPNQLGVGLASKPCELRGEHYTCQLQLFDLIGEAFQLADVQLRGPKWLTDQFFSVNAVPPAGTTPETARVMLQQALIERFGLKYHREKLPTKVFALVVLPSGSHLEPAGDVTEQKPLQVNTPVGTISSSVSYVPGHFFASGINMDQFATTLYNHAVGIDRPVVNLTNLKGEFKIDLKWGQDDSPESRMTGRDPGFLRVVESQLGLRLEKKTIDLDCLLIDSINKLPTPN